MKSRLPASRLISGSLSVALPLTLLLGAWALAARSNIFPSTILVPPQAVLNTFFSLMETGELQENLTASLSRVAAGFALGGFAGLAFGLALGLSSTFEEATNVIFHTLRQVPVIALAPLLLMLLGLGEGFKIAVIAYAAFFPVALNTMDGIRNVPAELRDVAAVLRFSPAAMIRHVMLPGALPSILTGFRLALSRSWMIVVAAELFGASEGLGYMISFARDMFQIDVIMVGIILTGLVGFLLDQILRAVEIRFSPWAQRGFEAT